MRQPWKGASFRERGIQLRCFNQMLNVNTYAVYTVKGCSATTRFDAFVELALGDEPGLQHVETDH